MKQILCFGWLLNRTDPLRNPSQVPLPYFFPLTICSSSHHQVILDVLAAVFAGALKVEMLHQLPLAVSRHIEEVHVADSQLLTFWDFSQSSQLNPGTKKGKMAMCYLSRHNIDVMVLTSSL